MNDGRLTTVVVRRAALENARQPGKAGDLVQAVVEYVNDVMREGVYHGQELPVAAAQAYHADFYLGQVMNGGHSQFIGNSDTNYPKTSADALDGLKAMGARAQHQILAEMIDWAKAHPEEVAPHNDFGSGNKLLGELNRRFYEVENQTSMIEHSANWIAGWPELRVVEDSEYAAEITRLAQLNPYLSSRKIWQGTRLLRYRMTDRLQLTAAAACGAVTPEPEIMLVVRPGSQMEIDGQVCKAFGVGTDNGTRLCAFEDTGGRLYEYIKNPLPRTPEERKAFKPATVGARLSVVTAETINRFSEMAKRTLACEAIDLLLRKGAMTPAKALTAWKLHDNGATWIVACGESRVVATTTTDRATLTQRDGSPIATVTRAEIEHHAAEAARGGASLPQAS